MNKRWDTQQTLEERRTEMRARNKARYKAAGKPHRFIKQDDHATLSNHLQNAKVSIDNAYGNPGQKSLWLRIARNQIDTIQHYLDDELEYRDKIFEGNQAIKDQKLEKKF